MRRVLKFPAFHKKKGSVEMVDLLAECGYTFKTSQKISHGSFENVWYKNQVYRPPVLSLLTPDCSAGGDLETALGNVIVDCFFLTGSAINTYLKEIGKCIKEKLSQSNLTGLVHPTVLLIAASIVHLLTPICAGYGAAIKPVVGKL